MSDPFAGIVVNLYINGGKGQRSSLASALTSLEQDRYTKAEANYRPNEEDVNAKVPRECATCSMYMTEGGGSGRCEIVVGDINPEYVCDYYRAGQTEEDTGE